MQDFQQKVAVVTGAASGIGFALAQTFAEAGMKIVMADIEEPVLSVAAADLAKHGHDVTSVVTDVTQPDDLEQLAQTTLEVYGGVHILCNNAGVFVGGRSWESPVADFQWIMDVNVWGVLHGIQAFVPVMLAQDTACHIVNTSSMAGLTALPAVTAYHVSKHAVMALSECLYKELLVDNSKIGVSVLCPEMIRTQIGLSARNRPSDPRRDPEKAAPSPHRELVEKGIIAAAEQGLDPQVISTRVLQAIRDERFYILPEADSWRDLCNTRLEDIRTARNPTLANPG